MHPALARVGNHLYHVAPAVYRPLYALYKRWSDRQERALIAGIVRPGMTVLDVGANIGEYTRFLARLVGPDGRVHAFEPEPENFARLQVAVRGLPQVQVMQAAVSDRSGEIALYVDEGLNVDHHSYDDGSGRRAVRVQAVALDDWLAPGQPVDLIKMDIQGAEVLALAGARRVLRENRALHLVVEYWPWGLRKSGHDPAELLAMLRDEGFQVRFHGGASQEALAAGRRETYVNLHAHRDPAA